MNLKALLKRKKINIAKTSQQTLPYAYCTEDGIMQHGKNRFSKSFTFVDINYQVSREEDQQAIFEKYCDVLNSFDSTVHIQVSIINKRFNKESLEERILLKEVSDHLQDYRKEYNNMLRARLIGGKNEISKQKVITISFEAESLDQAISRFQRMEIESQTSFKRMGSKLIALELHERLELLHDIYQMGQEGQFRYDPVMHKRQGLMTKDLIAPDSFTFKRGYFMLGDKYARAIHIKELPSYLSDRLVSELTDVGFNMIFTLNITPVDTDKARRLVKKQMTGMEANKIEYQKRSLKNGYLEAFIPHELKYSLEEADELLEDLNKRNQKMFVVNMIIVHFADDLETLYKDGEDLKYIANKFICQVGTLHYQQEDAINSVLPYGLNLLHVARTLTTDSTAVFMPFTNQELCQKNGFYYGQNAISRNLIMFDRLSLKTPNGFILGTPGSGKSFAAKREISNVLLNTQDDIIIIDPEAEYSTLVNNFKGEVIQISAGSKNVINPLDMSMNYSDDEDPLMLKSDFVLSLCEVILGGRYGLEPREKSVIDRCLKLTYHNYLQTFDPKDVPTLHDFYDQLKKQTDDEAQRIAMALELYVKGNLSVFANQTNIDLNNRLVCFNIKDLGKQLKTMGMLIVLDQIWNRITLNRQQGKRTWIYIDEIYLLFANAYSAQFLFELYKRARKWGGVPTGITQNIEDLLKSDQARSMLSNSDFLMMLNQAPSDRNELAKLLNISETQLSYVTQSDAGQGLLFIGNSIIPFIDQFPKNTKLYQMMTTKIDEVE